MFRDDALVRERSKWYSLEDGSHYVFELQRPIKLFLLQWCQKDTVNSLNNGHTIHHDGLLLKTLLKH